MSTMCVAAPRAVAAPATWQLPFCLIAGSGLRQDTARAAVIDSRGEQAMIRAIAAVAIALLAVIPVRAAEQPHRMCYSDRGVTCDNKTDVFAHCRSDVNAAARGVCAVRSELGVQFYPYKLTGGPGGGGGSCGWRVYNLTCNEMPTDSR